MKFEFEKSWLEFCILISHNNRSQTLPYLKIFRFWLLRLGSINKSRPGKPWASLIYFIHDYTDRVPTEPWWGKPRHTWTSLIRDLCHSFRNKSWSCKSWRTWINFMRDNPDSFPTGIWRGSSVETWHMQVVLYEFLPFVKRIRCENFLKKKKKTIFLPEETIITFSVQIFS